MKALEILKEDLKATGELYELGYKQEKDYKKILEAIKEIEELQNRKCDNCTHYARGLGCDLTYWEDYYSGYGFESEEYDFCSRWEKK